MSDAPFSRHSAVKAVLMTTTSTYVCYAVGLGVSIMITRALGAEQYGRYAYLVWLVGTLVTIANHGLTMGAIKFVAETSSQRNGEQTQAVTAYLRRMQFLSIGGVAIVMLLALPYLKPAGWEGSRAVLAGLCLVAFSCKAISMLTTSIAKGYRYFHVEAITNVVAVIIGAVLAVAAVFLARTFLAFSIIFVLTSVVYATASAFLMPRLPATPTMAPLDPELRRRIHHYVASTALLIVIGLFGAQSTAFFLLNRWSGPTEVAFLAIAYSLTRAGLELLVAGLSATTMPLMGQTLASGDRTRAEAMLHRTARYYQFMGLLVAGIGVCWADPLIAITYGTKFASVGPLFKLSVLTSGIMLTGSAFNAMIGNSDRNVFRIATTALSAILSLTLAILLIPSHGALGAVIGSSIATIVGTLVTMAGVHRFMHLSPPLRALAAQYLLFAVSGLIAWMTKTALGAHPLAQWAAGLIFALSFLAGSLAAGLWKADERSMAAGYLRRIRILKPLAHLIAP